jgi:hypothetical protein
VRERRGSLEEEETTQHTREEEREGVHTHTQRRARGEVMCPLYE